MATIKLSARKEFEPIPEGEYVFKVTEVEVNSKVNSIVVKAALEDGRTARVNCNIGKGKSFKQVALDIFSNLARAVLGEVEEVDPSDLEGGFFRAKVVHSPSDDPKRPWVNLKYFEEVDGWDEDEEAEDEEEDEDDYDPFS